MSPGLISNFIEYFNDNVCMMAMAATIGNLAGGLASRALGPDCGPVAQAQAQMAICFGLIALLRLIGLSLQRATKEGSVMCDVYSAMLMGLPWFLRVPMVVLLPEYLEAMYRQVGWSPLDPNQGKASVAFTLNVLVFMGMFGMLLLLGLVMRSFPDATQPDAKWSTFFVQSFYLAFLSGSGKAMHYAVRVVLVTLVGPIDYRALLFHQVLSVLVCLLMMTALAFFLLASALPNQMESPSLEARPFTQIHLTSQQYVVVYTWAYASVDFGWDALYDWLGIHLTSEAFGFFVFVCWLLACLATACMLAASTPDKNFYDMGKGNSVKAAACLMNYWLVDFITWWAQSQVMAWLDTDVESLGKEGVKMTESSWPVIWFNFFVIVALLFLIGGLHACNHKALLFKIASEAGHKSKVILNFAMVHNVHLENKLRQAKEQEEDDEDDDSKYGEEDEDEDSEDASCRCIKGRR